jgi:hypothetical protein
VRSPEQLGNFLQRVRGDPLYAAWLLFVTTGMRRGEVAGLRWPDVDLKVGRVSPRRPRVVVNYDVVVSEPKTQKGRRSVVLDPATVAALREHRTGQFEQRLAVGPRWQESGLVPGRMAAPSTRSASPDGLSSMPMRPACPRSGCTTSATAMPPPRWRPGFRPRWSASAWATPISPSPWTSTATSSLAWTPRPLTPLPA